MIKGLLHAVGLVGGLLEALQLGIAVIVLVWPAIDAPKRRNGLLQGLDWRVGKVVLVKLEGQGEAQDVGTKGFEDAHAVREESGGRVDKVAVPVPVHLSVQFGAKGDNDVLEVLGGDLGLELPADEAEELNLASREEGADELEDLDWNSRIWPPCLMLVS